MLLDTPGVVDGRNLRGRRHRARVASAWAAAARCDVLVFLVDAQRQLAAPDPRLARLLAGLSADRGDWGPVPPAILALNKMDLVDPGTREAFHAMRRELAGLHVFAVRGPSPHPARRPRSGGADEAAASVLLPPRPSCPPVQATVPISAKKGWGTEALLEEVMAHSEERPWELDGGVSAHSEESLAREIVREKLFKRLNQEVPYALAVRTVRAARCPCLLPARSAAAQTVG